MIIKYHVGTAHITRVECVNCNRNFKEGVLVYRGLDSKELVMFVCRGCLLSEVSIQTYDNEYGEGVELVKKD